MWTKQDLKKLIGENLKDYLLVVASNRQPYWFNFKKTYKYELNRGDQLFIPPGFGHGYFCKSKNSTVTYFCTETYDPKDENGFNYNDPIIQNLWPKQLFLIKKRDSLFKLLNDIKLSKLPRL